MAINLKPVDVVVVGLGAAGGVAVLPLARAGLKVAGIEAGTWMTKEPGKFFHADEIYNNVRGLVTTGTQGAGRDPHGPQQPHGTHTRREHASHDECDRRDVDPLSRPELAIQSLGFQGALGVDPALRRWLDPQGIDGRRLAHRLRRSGAVLRHHRT